MYVRMYRCVCTIPLTLVHVVSVGKGDMSTAIREGFISMDLEMMESMFACMSSVFACTYV